VNRNRYEAVWDGLHVHIPQGIVTVTCQGSDLELGLIRICLPNGKSLVEYPSTWPVALEAIEPDHRRWHYARED